MNASDGLFGIVTPYRNQANALQSVFAGSEWRAEYANTYRPHYAKNIENLID